MLLIIGFVVVIVIWKSFIAYMDCIDKVPWTSRYSEKENIKIKASQDDWEARMAELRLKNKELNKGRNFENFN